MSHITKKAIKASLNKLLMTKTLDKVTINDIAEDCGINRMTFYYHFKDIYDLVEWSWEEDAANAIARTGNCDTWQNGLCQIFEELKENRILIMNVFRYMNRERIEQYLYKVTYNLIMNVINGESEGMYVSEEDKSFIADFYKYAFADLILDWIRNDMRTEPMLIVEKLSVLMYGTFKRALCAFEK